MKIDRLLEMVFLFIELKKITASNLSKHFGVSIKTIRRDIDTLSIAGVPIFSESGKNGGYFIEENFKVRNEIFSKKEHELLSALVQGVPKNQKNKSVQGLFKKVIQSNNNQLSQNIYMLDFMPWSQNEKFSEILSTLDAAASAKQYVHFFYYKPYEDPEEREAVPVRIIYKSGSWYFKGHCSKSNDFRTFKVTRVKQIQIIDKYDKGIVDNQSEDDYRINWYGTSQSNKYTIRFYKPIYGQLENLIPEESIEWEKPYFDYTFDFQLDPWFISVLLSFREHIDIISDELREQYTKSLKKMANKFLQ